jgi:predicted transposase YdaD
LKKGIFRDVLVKHKAEVISMVLTSFNQKAYEKDLYEEGVEDGLDLGRMQMAQEIALRLFQSGNSLEQIAQLTGIDVEIVKQWIEKRDSSGCTGEA